MVGCAFACFRVLNNKEQRQVGECRPLRLAAGGGGTVAWEWVTSSWRSLVASTSPDRQKSREKGVMLRRFATDGDKPPSCFMPIQRLMSDEALLQELGRRIARLRLERNLSQAQLAEQAGISKRTLERLEAGAVSTQLSLFLRVLRQLDLLERLELLLPEPQPSPLALLEQQRATRKRASRRRTTNPPSTSTWSWGQP